MNTWKRRADQDLQNSDIEMRIGTSWRLKALDTSSRMEMRFAQSLHGPFPLTQQNNALRLRSDMHSCCLYKRL